MPSKELNAPLLPNFFLEIGGRKNLSEVLKRQATEDLAYGARALLEVQSYSNECREYNGNAYAIGSIFFSSVLKFFTMYPTQPADPTRQPTYHITSFRVFDLTQDAGTCRDGIT